MKIKVLGGILSTIVLALAPSIASATPTRQSVYLTFSGGNNAAPLVITLGTALRFEVTANTTGYSLAIDTGAPLDELAYFATSTVTSTLNGGSTLDINKVSVFGGTGINDLQADDLYLSNTGSGNVQIDDIIDFTTGSVTTNSNFYYTKPIDGLYDVFLVNNNGVIMASPIAVPEPSSYATLAGLAMLGSAIVYRRRKVA